MTGSSKTMERADDSTSQNRADRRGTRQCHGHGKQTAYDPTSRAYVLMVHARARLYQVWDVDVKTHPPNWSPAKVDLRLITPPDNETEFPHPTGRAYDSAA